MKNQDPISGYSKGARGLSVQSRVSGIFTAATVSPSSCRRQRSSRYTIRAGRNLPDKEFRSVGPTGFPAGWTLSWCPSIHLLPADDRPSPSRAARFELLEVDALSRSEGMLFEEWNDALEQLRIAFVLNDGELGQDLEPHRHALMS